MQVEPHSDITLAALMQVAATDQPTIFEGQTEAYGRLGIYGGHFLGQALAAAFETVDEPKIAHSFHAYFLRPGDPSATLTYHVNNLRDCFPMVQGGRVEMELIGKDFFEFDPQREPALKNWMRIPAGPSLSPRDRQIVLAYLSDGTLMFNSVIPHGSPFVTHRLTSLDHCVWFHRDTDPSQWLLFDQRSTAAADGRGINEGEIYDGNGQIVMSCAQESMLRAIPAQRYSAPVSQRSEEAEVPATVLNK
jgi:acyl-CoA thioesterase